jgi:polyisoprenoid-binding protein YceI
MRLFLAILTVAVPAFSQQVQVKLDTDASKVNFTLGDVFHKVHGTFKLTGGNLWFNSSAGTAGGELVVNAVSGNSGNHSRDSRMDKNVLQTTQYPAVTFTPDRIDGKVNESGDSQFGLHGLFAIHGTTHELTMNVKAHIEGDRLTAAANFDVPYVKWGMKNPSTLMLRVNDTVQVDIEASGQISQ